MITVGTGIGGGLIINGELYRGTIGAGAELGHVVIELDGPPLPGQLPRPRLRGDARLGNGAGARGPGGRRAGARLGPRPRSRPRARRSTARR